MVILFLKHEASSRVTTETYVTCLALSIFILAFRVWAAGFIGSTARATKTHANMLITAGPYRHVRNPMYLAVLVLGFLFGFMSGLRYSVSIWAIVYAFVYSQVIPYEQQFLRNQFGREYEEYCARVPRLIPALMGYDRRVGVFSLREALRNETTVLTLLPAFWILYWWL